MKPQAQPLDLGHTRGVRQRILKSLPAVRAAKDFDGAYQEAMRRMAQRLGHPPRLVREGKEVSSVRLTGRVIEGLGAEMVAADRALAFARHLRREACDRREVVRMEAYRELSSFRDHARGILGPQRSKHARCLNGDTERDPHYLLAHVRHVIGWATDEKTPPDDLGIGLDWSKLAAPLVSLHDELKTAIDEAVDAGVAVVVPLVNREKAIKAFDQEVQRGSRFLEATLVAVGLPTLAMAVRPHLKGTGRVGRPSKRPAVDEHPDLVDGLRSSGLLAEDSPAAEETKEPEARERTVARRRIVFGVASVSTPEPKETGTARRKRRIVRQVAGVGPTGRATRQRAVRRPFARPQERPDPASPPPWTARALDWWQRRGAAG